MSPELELSLCLIYNISIIVISKRQENYGSETLFWMRSRLHTPVFTDDIPRKILVSVYSSMPQITPLTILTFTYGQRIDVTT